MADVKISALPLATTPLAGTEVLPIVQSATTDQVTVANLTAGRAVSASSLTLTTTPLAVGSGGTGFSSLTAGYIPYASSTSALSFSSNLYSTGTNIGIGTATPAINLHVYSTAATTATLIENTTNPVYVRNKNSSGDFYIGTDSSTGGSFTGTAYARFLYSTGAYPLRFYTNGAPAMTLDESGNLGVGTTTTSTGKLNILTSTGGGNPALYISGNDQGNVRVRLVNTGSGGTSYSIVGGNPGVSNSGLGFYDETNSATRMYLDASGNLGIGSTTASRRLTAYTSAADDNVILVRSGAANAFIGFADLGTTSQTGLSVRLGSSGDGLIFQTGGTNTRASIVSDGTFNLGTTSLPGANLFTVSNSSTTGYGISVSCNSSNTTYRYFEGYSTSASAQNIAIYTDGNVRIAVGSTYANFSDAKLKTNIVDATSKLDDVCALKVRNFSSIVDPNSKYIGFIAQEVEEVFPSLVFSQEDTERDEGKEIPLGTYTKGVKESALIAVLTKAIQELAAKVQALEAKVA